MDFMLLYILAHDGKISESPFTYIVSFYKILNKHE